MTGRYPPGWRLVWRDLTVHYFDGVTTLCGQHYGEATMARDGQHPSRLDCQLCNAEAIALGMRTGPPVELQLFDPTMRGAIRVGVDVADHPTADTIDGGQPGEARR